MSSSFHLLDERNSDSTRGNARNLGLGDSSGSGIASNRSYASLTTAVPRETILSDGGSNVVVSTSSGNLGTTSGSISPPSSRSSWILLQRGRVVLLLLAVVYGSLNISMRLVFARPGPPTASASSTIQGWFAVLCFLPLLWGNQYIAGNENKTKGWLGIPGIFSREHPSHLGGSNRNNNPRSFWRFAVELAFFNFGTQALINMSLVEVQGARASFLVQMSVVFTPVVSMLFGQQTVSKRVWIACFVALTGLFILSYSEAQQEDDEIRGNNSPSLTFAWGDWCCLSAALCWSLYIYRLSAWGGFFDETTTQFVKNIVLALLYTLWMLLSLATRFLNSHEENNESTDDGVSLWKGWRRDPVAWCILFYSALGPCTLADVFQQKAQSSVPAAESNVILSMEPVFTTLLGFILLGEIPSLQELCGGLLIVIASVVSSCSPMP